MFSGGFVDSRNQKMHDLEKNGKNRDDRDITYEILRMYRTMYQCVCVESSEN